MTTDPPLPYTPTPNPTMGPDSVAEVPPAVGSTNRGLDNRFTSNDSPQLQVTLMMINDIVLEYFTNVIKPIITEQDTVRDVPVIYGNAERWADIRRFGFTRDAENGKLFTPLIMLRRTKVEQGKLKNPNNKYMYRTLVSGWNNRNAYDKFAVQNGIIPSKSMRTIVIPDYMDLTYEVMLWTDYQEQMDSLIEQINMENQDYWGERNNFKFRVNIDSFDSQNELPAELDRLVRTSFSMKIGAYLLPERMVRNFKLSTLDTKAYTYKKVTLIETVVNDINNIKTGNG